MNREKEIAQCFLRNPDIYQKSPRQMALFFFIQGEICTSTAYAVQREKAHFFMNELKREAPEAYEKALIAWDDAQK